VHGKPQRTPNVVQIAHEEEKQEQDVPFEQETSNLSAGYQWYHLIMPYACKLGFPKILEYSLFKQYELYQIMPVMEAFSFFMQTFLFNAGLVLNICIA
jgi:hypothetical protein